MNTAVIEIVNWKAKPGVDDAQMITAMNGKLSDLRQVSGFLHQSLYKNENEEWVGIYYWESEEEAHNSNDEMEKTDSFKHLLSLIDLDTVKIEVMPLLQSSGHQNFIDDLKR